MKGPRVPIALLTKFRKVLHKFPELSGNESGTARRVQGFLNTYRPTTLIEGIGGNGLAAVYQYSKSPTVMIRCELDALPIAEVNEFSHKTTVKGISHKCGHDGHMAMVAGLAAIFGRKRPKKGRVVLLFQPAEENGEGARAVLNDEKFQEIEPDYVLALHNIPGEPLHKIICRPGIFTPTVRSIIIKLMGRTAHAGEPENGNNPALAIANILQKTDKIQQPQDEPGFLKVTPVFMTMGEKAYGVSAGQGELHLTIRTWDGVTMDAVAKDIEDLAKAEAKTFGLEVGITWTQFFSSNKNDEEMVSHIKKAAEVNNLDYEEKKEPFSWGEDFGLFTEKYKGAMFGLGAGENTPALHNPDYDFPDELIPTGVNMLRTVVHQLLDE